MSKNAIWHFVKAVSKTALVVTAFTAFSANGAFLLGLVIAAATTGAGVLAGSLVCKCLSRFMNKHWAARVFSAILSAAAGIVLFVQFVEAFVPSHPGHIDLYAVLLFFGPPIVGVVAALFGAGYGQLSEAKPQDDVPEAPPARG